MKVNLYHGDSLNILRTLPENSIDSIVTDGPYMLGFMGKAFDDPKDNIAASVTFWKECLRVLKPGGHLLSFGGTRTYHRMATAIEDAGFEVRDMLQWLYGSAMPKSLNVATALNKLDGEIAQKFQGYGTGLKPANEPICLARKSISESTIAKNVLEHGTGGLNIDASRISTKGEKITAGTANSIRNGTFQEHEGYQRPWKQDKEYYAKKHDEALDRTNKLGRWPANVILGHSDECELIGTRKVKGTKPHPVQSKIEKYEGWGSITKRKGEVVARFEDKDGYETVENYKCSEDCPIFILN